MKRMSVPLLNVSQLAAPMRPAAVLRSPAPPTGLGNVEGGDLRIDFGARLPFLRMLAGPPDRQLTTNPAFTRVKLGSNIMQTEDGIETILDIGAAARDMLANRGDPVSVGEHDTIRRLTCQNGFADAAYLKHPSPPAVPMPAAYRIAVRRLLSRYLQRTPSDEPVPRPPMSTNAGFPLYISGVGAKIISAAMWLGDTSSSLKFAADVAGRLGLPVQAALAYGYNTRTGPTAKAAPLWVWNNEWIAYEEAVSHAPRRRHVWMGSMVGNLATRMLQQRCKASRRLIPGFYRIGTRDDDMAATMYGRMAALGGIMFEADLSGFDTSVPRTLQELVAEELINRWPDLRTDIESWVTFEALPCLYPTYAHAMPTAFSGSLVLKNGEISSGQLMTAEIGTIINAAALYYAFEMASGHRADLALDAGDLIFLIQGDDLLVWTRFSMDPNQFIAAYAELGLKLTILNGRRFLSQHRLPDGSRPLGARIIQQTCFNEHEPTGEAMAPINILGLDARWGVGPPSSSLPYVLDALSRTNLNREYGVFDGPSARKWLATAAGQYRLNRALESLKSLPWLKQVEADAPHSPSAAALWARLRAAGVTTTQTDHRFGWTAIAEMRTWPNRVKQNFVLDMINITLTEGAHMAASAAITHFIAKGVTRDSEDTPVGHQTADADDAGSYPNADSDAGSAADATT